MIAFCSKCLYNSCDRINRLLLRSASAIEKTPFSFNSISFLYCWRSVSDKRPLSARNEKQAASLPMISQNIPLASSKLSPAAAFRLMEMTGNFPMYLSQSSFSSAIASPSKSVLSHPNLKKHFNMLMFKVFPNLRGRVNKLT